MSSCNPPVQHRRRIGEILLTQAAEALTNLSGWLLSKSYVPRVKVYFEFDDYRQLFIARQEIVNSFTPKMLASNTEWERSYGDDTIELDLFGVSIVLTCKQRWMTPEGKDVGPLDSRFGKRQPKIR